MDDSASIDDMGRNLMDEHRDVLSAVRAVEAMVEASVRATGDVARKLDALAEMFATHIADEEASALYSIYPERYSEVEQVLRSLQAEHRPLIEQLRQAARDCNGATSLDFDSPLSIRIRKTIAALRRHEAAEAEAIQEIRALAPTSGGRT
jgi:hypothetical protein